MRVLVCGSRVWTNKAKIAARLSKLPEGSVVIQGTARGADTIAADYADSLGYEVEDWPADWSRGGPGAGLARNLSMLDSNPDLVIAFWDGRSRGTLHTITEARKRGIPVEEILEDTFLRSRIN